MDAIEPHWISLLWFAVLATVCTVAFLVVAGMFPNDDDGSFVKAGYPAAVVNIGRLRFSGYPAWLLWCFIHILWLIGFRNRFLVMIEWAWAYLRFERSARLITGRRDA